MDWSVRLVRTINVCAILRVHIVSVVISHVNVALRWSGLFDMTKVFLAILAE